MAKGKRTVPAGKQDVAKSKKPAPRSLAIAATGVSTGRDFASLMSALMSDLIDGRVETGVANAVCKAGDKLLKVVEMQHRYGAKVPGGALGRALELAPAASQTVQ